MLTLADIRAAATRLGPHIVRTPVLTHPDLDRAIGARVFFKAEHRQGIRAFKIRGATNAILLLPDDVAARGVVTHSSGNHAAAVACAARIRGIPAHVVMPVDVPPVKRANVLAQGARIIDCEPTLDSRESVAARVLEETGGTLIHPYNDYAVMAGQGTAALELLEDQPDLDLVLCPVGGGGLLSGTAVAAKALRPGIRVVGVEPAAAADAAESFRTGRLQPPVTPPVTVADGLRGALGELTFAAIRTHVDDIVTVGEAAIIGATAQLAAVFDEPIEPSSGVPWAGLVEGRVADVIGRRIGIILSGGNIDGGTCVTGEFAG